MASERPSKDIKDIWSAQATEGFTMSLDEIRARSAKLQSIVRIRNLVEYAAAAVVVIGFGVYTLMLPGLLVKAGSAMVVLGTFVVVWQLHRRASARTPPLAASVLDHIAFYRSELVRQRDALRSVATWYLGPLVPGMAVFLMGMSLKAPVMGVLQLRIATVAGLCIVVFGAVWWLNRWTASRLQKQIDALGHVDSTDAA